ncbi:mechanosensitive ion channel family protein [Bowmanella dokdonensis]|uniref:Small-conductance mechanosensitive channel n=1 Tax=Bowmanella dokdonensis TaxID=751969 RepID=A0A939DPZ0_9ALTE|nr:mechanosensitive ion channel family protein [Bowmanella dokdonensis]MBN7826818.1 mechanosensitive ion channel family protein [Bowmanella dokdonensis]
MSQSLSSDWQSAVTGLYSQLLEYLVAYLPNVIGALLLVLAGWLVAWLMSRLTLSIIRLLNRMLSLMTPAPLRGKGLEIRTDHSRVASKVIFWLIMLFFFAAAMSILGLDLFSAWLGGLISYLPRMVAGLLIIVGGYLLSNLVSTMTRATAESAGLPRALWLAAAAKFAVLFTALVIGVEQLGINIHFITSLVLVVAAVLGAGLALAFGLGSKGLIANVVGARQARKHCQIHDQMVVGDTEGVLVEITDTMLVLETQAGRTLIPARFWLEQQSCVRQSPVDTPNKPSEPSQ